MLELDTTNTQDGERDLTTPTPVHQRREWLKRAFRPTEKERAPPPGNELVHKRLSWIEQEKRKSFSFSYPNNKDASNIPSHLVEDRKRWLDSELENMLSRRCSRHHPTEYVEYMNYRSYSKSSSHMEEFEERYHDYPTTTDKDMMQHSTPATSPTESRDQVLDDNYSLFNEHSFMPMASPVTIPENPSQGSPPPQSEEMGMRQPLDVRENIITEQGVEDEEDGNDHDDNFHAEMVPVLDTEEDGPQLLSEYSEPYKRAPAHYYSSVSATSLADYARQSAHTFARAKLPAVGCVEEELIDPVLSPHQAQQKRDRPRGFYRITSEGSSTITIRSTGSENGCGSPVAEMPRTRGRDPSPRNLNDRRVERKTKSSSASHNHSSSKKASHKKKRKTPRGSASASPYHQRNPSASTVDSARSNPDALQPYHSNYNPYRTTKIMDESPPPITVQCLDMCSIL